MNEVLDVIKDYGGYAGAASLLGLAVLSLLYFAQAREVKRLREWAGRAPERAAELEARVAAEATRRATTPAAPAARPGTPQTAAAQAAAKPGAPAVKPAGGANGQPGSVPAPAPAGAAAAAAGAAAASPAAKPDAPEAKPAPGTPATPDDAKTDGAPPAKPDVDQKDKAPEEPAKPADKTPAPQASAPAASPPATDAPAPAAAPAGATGAAATGAAATGAAAAAAKPPVAPPAGALPPRTAAARPRGPVPPPRAAAAARTSVPSATVPPRDGTTSTGGGFKPIIAIVGALLVIVVGIVFLVSGGEDSEPTATQEPNVVAPAPASTTEDEPTPRGDISVAVLNGTTVTGLAKRTAERIEGAGFDVPDDLVTDAVEQNRSATVVMYAEGAREEAREVAKVIGVGSDALDVIDQSARTLTQGRARVVVTVGADQSQQ